MANLQIKVDDCLKEKAVKVTSALGMDVSTAVRIFLSQMVVEQGLPFKPNINPFYKLKNQEALADSLQELKQNKVIIKDLSELLGKAE